MIVIISTEARDEMAKILFEHANEFNYSKESFNSPTYTECLIARISIEKGDEFKVKNISKAILEVYLILKPKLIILFPFAHLSNNLIEIDKAEEIFKQLTENLGNLPKMPLSFGISKGYSLNIKNHKLNNIFRSI